jgi:hypothetical protein
MDSNEFWCRAFLTTIAPVFQACIGTGAEESSVAAQCADMADAALAVAQRRGMVTASQGRWLDTWKAQPATPAVRPAPELERVEFTAERDGDIWTLRAPGWTRGVQVRTGGERYPFGPLDVLCIKWGESCPPKPIEVWLERAKGGS